jgi:putative ABC transport system permease protein
LFAGLLDRVRTLPGVISAGGTSLLPLQRGGWQDRPGGGWSNQGFIIENHLRSHDEFEMTADPRVVTPGYFEAMFIPLRSGRLFSNSDKASSPHVVIVNETMAQRYWHGASPVGQRISFKNARGEPPSWMEIVGIVGDTKTAGLDAPSRPEFMLPFDQSVWSEADLVVRTSGDPFSLANAVRQEVRTLNRNISVTHVRTMEEFVSDSILQPRLRTLILVAFSVLALTLASVGLYGVMSYTVTQTRQEIGIRIALGATQPVVLRMVLGRGLRTTMAGIVIGTLASLVVSHVLRSLLFGVSSTDSLAFSGAALLLLVVAMFSSYLPARRAMRVDPATVLKSE